MLQLIALHALAALLAPVLIRHLHRGAYLALALVPASSGVWAALQTSKVLAGDYPVQTFAWVPELGLEISFRLDTLSWLMALIVGLVGALILVYCSGYFSRGAGAMGRFSGVFVAFAGAMFGLVATDNTLMLYLFWELTTIFSFLLIGHYHERQPSRRAAMMAITVTSVGGLAMLAGLIMLGIAPGGSFTLSELLPAMTSGSLFAQSSTGFLSLAAALILLGALTKSAQFPFHFWLPAAMAAPTPVSAYLHAAAMVKAGVYLIARFSPGFSQLPLWRWTLIVLGIVTMLHGGIRALRQFDLKLLLAYGTVSQLGFILVLVGYGTQAVALAGLTMLTAHALFKSTLFLTVGAIDHELGTRDLRNLSGLWRDIPGLMVAATVAAMSMAGLPPMLGYVGKEAAFEALTHDGATGWGVFLGLIVGSILTMAYTLRFWWGAFADKPIEDPAVPHAISLPMMAPLAVLASGSLILGVLPGVVDHAVAGHAALYPGEAGHLTLWAGFGWPVAATLLIIAGGFALFWRVGRQLGLAAITENDPAAEVRKPRTAADNYRSLTRGLNFIAADVTSRVQRGSLPSYLSTMTWTLIIAVGLVAVLVRPTWPSQIRLWDSPTQAGIALLACVAAVLVVRARRRMKAVLLLSFVGYATALLFALQGAPDLALTQALVETVTLVVFVLVLRRLPAYFSDRPWRSSRVGRMILGAIAGITVALLGWFAASARIHPPVTVDYPREVYEFGYGKNIVNVTLVDTRAWDTMGEISVLLAAATGVASLIFLRTRVRPDFEHGLERARKTRPVWHSAESTGTIAAVARTAGGIEKNARKMADGDEPRRGRVWLAGSTTLAVVRRSIIFEVGARLVFHPLMLFSLFLLFAGHNQPGGGFAGGTVAGIALIIRYLAGGRYELAFASRRIRPGALLGVGMLIATGAAIAPLFFGGTILQTTVVDFSLPLFGPIHLATALFFDMGVYLIVVGLVLDILTSLGAEIDRQAEAQGEQAPDVAYDTPGTLDGDTTVQPAVSGERSDA